MLPYGVGVLAETPWAAFEARQALIATVTWSRTGTAWGFDSDKGIDAFAAAARDPKRAGDATGARSAMRAREMPKAAASS